MKETNIEKCPYCGGSNIGIGYRLGNGRLFTDMYAYHSQSSASEVETYFCKDCGIVICEKVIRPEIFDNVSDFRGEELLDMIEDNGFILVNKHPYLPSLDESGFSMQNIIHLIERHQVVYSKAFMGRTIFLSIRCYQLLKRVKAPLTLDITSEMILKELGKYNEIQKEEIKEKLGIDTKIFNRAFDKLLERMKITACGGKKIKANWYTYLYCSTEQLDRQIAGLHFNGDPRMELWDMVKKKMTPKDFERLCK